ncbi:TetR/AcrR family transcriptional regulator [Pseudonocardia sp. ICBG1122]|nr:TetR/AcrR family transcriptional regulator [Pseudonocardia pini]
MPQNSDFVADELPAPITDRRQIRGAERRAAILVAAISRFGRQGYEHTRLRDVARDAGVTDAGLLYHFRTKDDLFAAAVEHQQRHYDRVAHGADVTVREFFDSLVAAVEKATADPELIRFEAALTAQSVLEDHPAHGRAKLQLGEALDTLPPLFRRAAERGEIRTDVDAVQLTLEIVALIEGIRSLWVARPDAVDLATVLRNAVEDRYSWITRPA